VEHEVFISYSSQDKAVADAICAAIEAKGSRCWMAPRNILPGVTWAEAINKAISRSRLMVLVFSSHANQSRQVEQEVNLAVHHGLVIIPCRIEDVPLSKTLEYYIATRHWMDAQAANRDQQIDYLADTVRLNLARIHQGGSSPEVQLPEPPKQAQPRLGRRWRVPLWWYAAAAVGIALTLAGAYALRPRPGPIEGPAGPVEMPAAPQYLITQVRRGAAGDQVFPDLKSALPLRTGDRFLIRCDLPPGAQASLFAFDPKGELASPQVQVAPAGALARLSFPADGFAARLTGPPGTEFLLVCASRSGPVRRDVVEDLFAGERPWPELPPTVVMRMDRDTVEFEKLRGMEVSRDDPIGIIQARMEKLRLKLRDHFEFLAGVAYAHES
jgi:hypothetical protein